MSTTVRRTRAHTVICALILASALLAFATVDAAAAALSPGFYGVNSGAALLNDAAGRPAAFAAMRAGGLSFVRADASWSAIEPVAPVAGAHTYVWATYDLFVADLARYGLRWYPMLGYGTPWATSVAGDLFAPPSGDAAFAAFAAAFARRYGTGGSFWTRHPELPALPTTVYEIWNEPSLDTFWHGAAATPARYMSLYLAAHTAIEAVDAGARVATAGLLDSPFVDARAFLQGMLASAPAARDQIDALGWHPYLGDVDLIESSVGRARSTLDAAGLSSVPIEVSEVGWNTGVPTEVRTDWLRRLAATLPFDGMNVTRLLPYVWSDSPTWQITNPDGSLGPLGDAYFAGIRDALSPEPVAAAPLTSAQPATGSKTCARKRRRSAKKRRSGSARKCRSGSRRPADTAKTP